MDCFDHRELISARLDGETDEGEERALDAHLERCAGCRQYHATASAIHRRLRVTEIGAVPDQTARIMASLSTPRPSIAGDLLRALVAGLGMAKIAAAVGVFLSAIGGGTPHTGTELAAVDLAIGAGLLLAAWRPVRATGLVPVLGVLAVATMAVGVTDLAAGRVTWTGELFHLLDGLGALLVWWLSTPQPGRRRGASVAA